MTTKATNKQTITTRTLKAITPQDVRKIIEDAAAEKRKRGWQPTINMDYMNDNAVAVSPLDDMDGALPADMSGDQTITAEDLTWEQVDLPQRMTNRAPRVDNLNPIRVFSLLNDLDAVTGISA